MRFFSLTLIECVLSAFPGSSNVRWNTACRGSLWNCNGVSCCSVKSVPSNVFCFYIKTSSFRPEHGNGETFLC